MISSANKCASANRNGSFAFRVYSCVQIQTQTHPKKSAGPLTPAETDGGLRCGEGKQAMETWMQLIEIAPNFRRSRFAGRQGKC